MKLGTRSPDAPKVREWLGQAGARATAGSFEDAAAFAELAVLATRWEGTENALKLAGPERLAGKVVVDVTNPLSHGPGGAPTLALGFTDSAAEQVQRWLPGARVVKAFNIVNAAHMYKPAFPGGPPDMLICGDVGL